MRRLVLTIVVTILSTSLFCEVIANSYSNVTVSEAWTMINSNYFLVILDVRTQSEYDSGHIGNAKHIPVTQLPGRLNELNTTDRILVYCGSGGRSATASQTLVDNDFLHIYNMLGGITAWITAGYPVYIKYASIQEAINSADEGEAIYVSSGTYYENLVVNKSISLIGEDKNITTIDGSGAGAVIHVAFNNTSISGFTTRHGGTHIDGGIKLETVNNCSVFSNIIRDPLPNGVGLILQSSSNNNIFNNILINNTFTNGSIALYDSHNNMIYENYVTDYNVGVFTLDATNNWFTKNTIRAGTYGTREAGFRTYRSNFNSLFGNTIEDNKIDGFQLVAGTSNTTVFHNNFVNNMNQINLTGSFNTTWDNGCEGNYWSNYNGTDLDNDGVGDTALPWESVDHYPLINPYWNSGDIDHDFDVDIFDVVKAAGIYGSTSFDPGWNPHCDIAEPYGVIDIFDMVTIAMSYGEEYNP